MSLEVDFRNVLNRNDFTNFGAQLIRLIFKADLINRAKLKQVYPNPMKMVEHYKKTGEVLELDYD